MSPPMRAFVAIDLPAAARAALAAVQQALPAGRAVAPDNLHLTLAFLGEHPEARIEEVHYALERIALPGFDLTLAGLDSFGRAAPRVLFVGADGGPALDRLHRRVRGAAHSAGIQLPRERFRPHVTLARFRPELDAQDRERLRRFLTRRAGVALPAFPVTDFALYRSTLRPDGPVHEELARYPLG